MSHKFPKDACGKLMGWIILFLGLVVLGSYFYDEHSAKSALRSHIETPLHFGNLTEADVDERIKKVNGHMSEVDDHMSEVDDHMTEVEQRVVLLEKKITELERKSGSESE